MISAQSALSAIHDLKYVAVCHLALMSQVGGSSDVCVHAASTNSCAVLWQDLADTQTKRKMWYNVVLMR